MTTSEYISDHRSEAARPVATGRVLRPVLWLLLAVSGAANVMSQSMNLNPFISIGFGVLTVSFGVALGMHHYRHRRSTNAASR